MSREEDARWHAFAEVAAVGYLTRMKLVDWYLSNGGDLAKKKHRHLAVKAHALKFFEEACELCYAAGLVYGELDKVSHEKENTRANPRTTKQKVAEETADVFACLWTICLQGGIELDEQIRKKLPILNDREWADSGFGVLRRPERVEGSK